MASSLVGVSTRARTGRNARPFPSRGRLSFCRMGSAKTAVFPVPVWAHPSRSFPASTWGIAFSWIGVGTVYFFALTARSSSGENPRSENVIPSCSIRESFVRAHHVLAPHGSLPCRILREMLQTAWRGGRAASSEGMLPDHFRRGIQQNLIIMTLGAENSKEIIPCLFFGIPNREEGPGNHPGCGTQGRHPPSPLVRGRVGPRGPACFSC